MANKRLLKATGADLATVAHMLQAKGRGKDKILAHITPGEAVMLKIHGGRGSRHPETGLLEFDDTPLPETVISTGHSFTPAISAPPPTVPKAAPPPAPTPVANAATPETVTVTGTAPSAPAISSPIPAPAPLVAPTVAAPATAAPAVQAPETVTVTGNQPGPAIQPPAPLPTSAGTSSPPAAAAPDDQSLSDRAKGFLSNNSTLIELGGLGLLGAMGTRNNAKAAGQGATLESNLANLAAPLSTAGTGELNATLQGGLTPARLQALQAITAQLGQSQAMGAVSSQQVAQSISGAFATQLQSQLQEALSILNQADGYLQSAYIDGYNANVANQTNTTNFYTTLATLAARMAGLGGSPATTGAG